MTTGDNRNPPDMVYETHKIMDVKQTIVTFDKSKKAPWTLNKSCEEKSQEKDHSNLKRSLDTLNHKFIFKVFWENVWKLQERHRSTEGRPQDGVF